MHKKPLFLVTFLLFLFTFCSGCVKNLENCKFLPKIELEERKNTESIDKKMTTDEKIVDSIKNGTTSATASCNF
jgi:hypothetical protein